MLSLKLSLVLQAADIFTCLPGEVPVIPNSNAGMLSRDDIKRIAISFMRSGCPTVQVLFHGSDKEDCHDKTPDAIILLKEWGEFLDIVKLDNEEFEFHGLKGVPTKEYSPSEPLNMSVLITRKVMPPKIKFLERRR